MIRIASIAAAAAVTTLGVASAFATVVSPTYTADQAAFPGAPTINTTGTGSAAVNSNFTTNVATTNSAVLDQTFVATTAGTLGSIAFYSAGVGTGGTGTAGTSVVIRLYQLGVAGTPASGGFQGGGNADQYVFPNATVASNTLVTPNPDLLGTYAPTFDVSASTTNRYITLDLSGAAIALLANTTYAIELQNTSAVELDAKRAGGTDFYTSGNVYGGAGATTGANRGLPNSGGVRDGAFAVYYGVAVTAPEPASLCLLGLGGLMAVRRRRA